MTIPNGATVVLAYKVPCGDRHVTEGPTLRVTGGPAHRLPYRCHHCDGTGERTVVTDIEVAP